MKRLLLALLGRHARRRGRFSAELALAARYYLEHYDLDGGDFEATGEAGLVRRLARAGALGTVFDVGANRGEWTRLVREAAASATVHAFEVAPPTARKLAARFDADPAVRVNAFGLAEADGKREVTYFPDHDTVTTLVAGMDPLHCADERRGEAVRVRRGDGYCREQGIEHVDLLKIDTEGAEDLVLAGFGEMLEQGRIDVIQFEYGMANIYTHHLLLDFYRELELHGYRLGKLYRRGVRFEAYKPWREDFRGPNYVAIASARRDLVAALAYRA